MSLHKSLLAALLTVAALGSAALPTAAQARGYVAISVGVRPPPPRYERVIARPGWVWAPGHWRWAPRAQRYVWAPGYWIAARPGWRWVGPRWVPRGPHWVFRAGYWAR